MFTNIYFYNRELLRIRMLLARDNFTNDHLVKKMFLNPIDFSRVDRIKMSELFGSEFRYKRRDIGIRRYPGKRDFHSENEMKKTKKQYFPMDYMEDTVFFKREWKKLWHREYASARVECFFVGRSDRRKYDITRTHLRDKVR